MVGKTWLLGASLALLTILSPALSPVRAADIRDETVKFPAQQHGKAIPLTATLYTPHGNGPFPLVVINHGKNPGRPADQTDARFYSESLQFVKRGYAVIVPVRAGFGSSGGAYISSCGQSLTALGQIWADDVAAAIDYARTLPYIDARRIVVLGASQGGLVSTALGSRDVPGLVGIVNFAGGLRQNCHSWADRNIEAFRAYGKQTRVPALFIYGTNDAYWGNGALSRRFFDAYHAGNPRSTYADTGAFAKDTSHHVFENFDGMAIWVPIVGRFFQRLGLPWEVVRQPQSTDTGIDLDDLDAVPFQRERNTIRAGYERFLLMDPKAGRAFALSENGAWSRQSGKDAAEKALAACRSHRGVDCRVYAVDNQVVYPK